MKPSFLVDQVKPLCTTVACLQLYTDATEWHLFPERRKISSSKSTKPRRCRQYLMAITDDGILMKIMYYCTETLQWMKWTRDMESRCDHVVAVMEDNLYIVGGEIEGDHVNTVRCLNLETMTLKEISPMNERRGYTTAVAVLKGFLYAVGGTDGRTTLSSVEKWNPINDTWDIVASMSVSRRYPGVTALNGKLYVVGGYNNDGNHRSAEYYDPEENVWVSIASMHKARRIPGLVVANGMLYTIAGYRERTIERYNPDSDEWIILCKLNGDIVDNFCTLFGDKVMLLYDDRVEEYNFQTNDCKVNPSINGLVNVCRSFSYSGRLFVEKFVEK